MIAVNVGSKNCPTPQTLMSQEKHYHKHVTESETQNTVFVYFCASKRLTTDLQMGLFSLKIVLTHIRLFNKRVQ